MQNYINIFYYGILVLSVIISIVCSLITFFNRNKTKRKQDANKIADNNAERTESVIENSGKSISRQILDKLPTYIIAAEQLYNSIVPSSMQKTGAQKLAYVLDKVKIDCLTNGEKYDEDYITGKVNELVDLTKQVNK